MQKKERMGTRSSFSNTIKDTIITPPYIFRQRVSIIVLVRVSLTVMLKELIVSMIFRIVHPYISIHSAE